MCIRDSYTLISKSSNQMVDFDIEAVKKRDNSNPVYYVQYAHARVCSCLLYTSSGAQTTR